MKKLNQEIVEKLANELNISERTVKKNIYNLVKDYSGLTKNAVAQIYARQNGKTVFRKLDNEDKATLPSMEVIPEKIKIKSIKTSKTKKQILFNYETDDYFKKEHIDELHRAYNNNCYTAVFILARKIIENLIIDILRKKYPEKKKENKELYFDINKRRFKDFGIILDNLYKKRNDFGTENRAVERLYTLAKKLKDNSNHKTHSWYHLVKRKIEIEDLDINQIINIIKKLEK